MNTHTIDTSTQIQNEENHKTKWNNVFTSRHRRDLQTHGSMPHQAKTKGGRELLEEKICHGLKPKYNIRTTGPVSTEES